MIGAISTVRTIQKCLALGLMGVVLYLLQVETTSWAVWCILGLTLVLEHLGFMNGVEHALQTIANMTDDEVAHVRKIMNQTESN